MVNEVSKEFAETISSRMEANGKSSIDMSEQFGSVIVMSIELNGGRPKAILSDGTSVLCEEMYPGFLDMVIDKYL